MRKIVITAIALSLIMLLFVGCDTSTNSTVSLKWQFKTDGSIKSSPAVVDGVVYVGSRDNFLYAIDINSGVKKWSFETGGDIFSSPAVVDGVVYIGSNDESLYAIDKDTGELTWRYETNSSVGSTPSVVDGVVFAGDNDGFPYAVDAIHGDLKWSTPTMPSYAFSSPSPTVFEDIVCIGSRTHLYTFEKNTGKLGRKRDCMGDYLPTININDCSTPTVVDGVIYFGTFSSLSAYSTKNCKFRWSFETKGFVLSSPSVVNNVVYFVSGDGFLYAVKTSNGELKWKYYIGRNKSQSLSPPPQ
jgi:outer membrane protein assembly factor BamB